MDQKSRHGLVPRKAAVKVAAKTGFSSKTFLGHVEIIRFQVHVVPGRIQFFVGCWIRSLSFFLVVDQKPPTALCHLILSL